MNENAVTVDGVKVRRLEKASRKPKTTCPIVTSTDGQMRVRSTSNRCLLGTIVLFVCVLQYPGAKRLIVLKMFQGRSRRYRGDCGLITRWVPVFHGPTRASQCDLTQSPPELFESSGGGIEGSSSGTSPGEGHSGLRDFAGKRVMRDVQSLGGCEKETKPPSLGMVIACAIVTDEEIERLRMNCIFEGSRHEGWGERGGLEEGTAIWAPPAYGCVCVDER